jgi:hypothetical protein
VHFQGLSPSSEAQLTVTVWRTLVTSIPGPKLRKIRGQGSSVGRVD